MHAWLFETVPGTSTVLVRVRVLYEYVLSTDVPVRTGPVRVLSTVTLLSPSNPYLEKNHTKSSIYPLILLNRGNTIGSQIVLRHDTLKYGVRTVRKIIPERSCVRNKRNQGYGNGHNKVVHNRIVSDNFFKA